MIVDLIQDVVCPWCRIGYANLQATAAMFPDDPMELRLRPFFLDPNTPEGGVDYAESMAKHAGNSEMGTMHDRVIEAGKSAGVHFRFDLIKRRPNTLLAHTAIYAAPQEKRAALLEALQKAYFEEGRDIGDREEILAIVAEAGLDAKAINAALSYPDFRKLVEDQATTIANDGVRQVPFFVMNDTLSLAGAYPPAQLAQAWKKATELAAEAKESESPAEAAAPAPSAEATAPVQTADATAPAPVAAAADAAETEVATPATPTTESGPASSDPTPAVSGE